MPPHVAATNEIKNIKYIKFKYGNNTYFYWKVFVRICWFV